MKILLVAGRPPFPPRRGDQLRTLQFLEALLPRHEVTLLAPGSSSFESTIPRQHLERRTFRPAGQLRVLGSVVSCLHRGLPAQCGLFRHPELAAQVRQLAPRHDLVILQLARLAPLAEVVGDTPLMVDLIDALSLGFETRAAVDAKAWRPFLRAEARRLEQTERRLLEASHRTLLVSDRDKSWMAQRMPELASRLSVVPLAVEPARRPGTQPPGSSPSVAITGNLGYFPNRDAVGWWLEEVWPELARRRPDLALRVAGDRPPRSLRSRVRRSGARLEERPRDLRALLAAVDVALAPLRCGAGTPVKILEAWSVGVPVVASPAAAEGAGARDGEEALVAESPDDWIRQVDRLLDDAELRRHLAARALARLVSHHSPEVVRERLEQAIVGAAPVG
jgi:polysaccharide biosynthesis protein PslH